MSLRILGTSHLLETDLACFGKTETSSVALLGNGLSIGFDPNLATAAITERIQHRLGDELVSFLHEIVELAGPEIAAATPIGVNRGGFERLAGPLDRIADLLIILEETVPDTPRGEVAKTLRRGVEMERLRTMLEKVWPKASDGSHP